MIVVELRSVGLRRGSGRRTVQALVGVDLTIAAGELVLIEGPSGAGKTTLLTVAAGLLTPGSGDVLLAGQRLNGMSQRQLRRHRARSAGFVFQRANLLEGLTVVENVLIAAGIAGLPDEEARDRADDILAELGIAHLAERRGWELSGGEEQRVAVARALVHRPQAVFADEPTGNLDSVAGRTVTDALTRLCSDLGIAVVVASHDPRMRPLADRRLEILDGSLREVAA